MVWWRWVVVVVVQVMALLVMVRSDGRGGVGGSIGDNNGVGAGVTVEIDGWW